MSFPFQKDKNSTCIRCDDGTYPSPFCSSDCDFNKFYNIACKLVKSQPNRKIRYDLNTEIIFTAQELALEFRKFNGHILVCFDHM